MRLSFAEVFDHGFWCDFEFKFVCYYYSLCVLYIFLRKEGFRPDVLSYDLMIKITLLVQVPRVFISFRLN